MMRRLSVLRLVATMLLVVSWAVVARGDESEARTQLQKITAKHAKAYLSLARKWKTKDPDLAERALRRALLLDKGNAKASEMLKAMGRWGTQVLLFDGNNLDQWVYADPPEWTLASRELRGNSPRHAYLVRSSEHFEGNYSLRMEAKLLEAFDGPTFFSLSGDSDGKDVRFEVGVLRGNPVLQERDQEGERNDHFSGTADDVSPRLDPRKWNTYEIRFIDDTVTALINGQPIADADRSSLRGGFAGIVVQHCHIAIRRVEARKYE